MYNERKLCNKERKSFWIMREGIKLMFFDDFGEVLNIQRG